MEEKFFIHWINSTLAQSNSGCPEIDNIDSDLSSGVILLCLSHTLVGDEEFKYTPAPKHRVQKIEYANQALFVLRKTGIRIHGVGAEDIVDGNQKMILGLLWQLFCHFRINRIRFEHSSEGKTEMLSGEAALLRWCQEAVQNDETIKIQDFTTSWQDGKAFCAILSHYFPNDFEWTKQKDLTRYDRFRHVFDWAESYLKVPHLIDVESLTKINGEINSKSIVLYLATLQGSIQAKLDSLNSKNMSVLELQRLKELLDQESSSKSQILTEANEEKEKLSRKLQEIENQFHEEEMKLQKQQAEKEHLEEIIRTHENEKNYLKETIEQQNQNILLVQSKFETELSEKDKIISELNQIISDLRMELEQEKKLRNQQEFSEKSTIENSSEKLQNISISNDLSSVENNSNEENEKNIHDLISNMKSLQYSRNKAFKDLNEMKIELENSKKKIEELKHSANKNLQFKGSQTTTTPTHSKKFSIGKSQKLLLFDETPQNLGALLKEGWLSKESKGKFERRYFKLYENELIYAKDDKEGTEKRNISFQTTIHFNTCEDIENCFEMLTTITGDKKIRIKTDSQEEMIQWIQAIQERVGLSTYIKHMTHLSQPTDPRIIEFFSYNQSNEFILNSFVKNPLETISAISIPLQFKTNLKSVCLVNCDLEDIEIQMLSRSIAYNSSIEKLSLENNLIGDVGCRELGEMLKKNKVIKSLNLSSNQIGDQGCAYLSDSMTVHKTLTSLDLRNNRIRDPGASKLAESLKSMNIHSILLGFNFIGPTGARSIAQLLKNNTQITEVDLENNFVADEGFKAIAESLYDNLTIKLLKLNNDGISDESADIVKELFIRNKKIIRLQLSDNAIGCKFVNSFTMGSSDLSFPKIEIERVFGNDYFIESKNKRTLTIAENENGTKIEFDEDER